MPVRTPPVKAHTNLEASLERFFFPQPMSRTRRNNIVMRIAKGTMHDKDKGKDSLKGCFQIGAGTVGGRPGKNRPFRGIGCDMFWKPKRFASAQDMGGSLEKRGPSLPSPLLRSSTKFRISFSDPRHVSDSDYADPRHPSDAGHVSDPHRFVFRECSQCRKIPFVQCLNAFLRCLVI